MRRISALTILLIVSLYLNPLSAVRTLSQEVGGVTDSEPAETRGDRERPPRSRSSTGKRPQSVTPNEDDMQVGEVGQDDGEDPVAEAIPVGEGGARFDGDLFSKSSSVRVGLRHYSGAAPGAPFHPSAELFLFNEEKGTHDLDLNYTTLRFGRDGQLVCRRVAMQLPVDPVGGEVLRLADDMSIEVTFRNGFLFPFSGALYTSAWVSSNGFVSFGEGSNEHQGSLDTHSSVPRVSGLFTDLHPGVAGVASWKQEGDTVAVTWHEVASYGHQHTTHNTFQILLEASGEVSITLLHVQPMHDAVVGLSGGGGGERAQQEQHLTDLSAAPVCQGAALHHHATHGEAALFLPWTFNLSFLSLKFDASGVASPCTTPATEFPVDSSLGDPIDLDDDSSVEVDFPEGFNFPFFGRTYSSVFVGSNGYLTFGGPDVDFYPTLPEHYQKPRISALFADLHPATGGNVTFSQDGDDVVAFTYERVESLLGNGLNSFQIALHATGEVVITYLRTSVVSQVVVGTSSGEAVFPLRSIDLASRPTCPTAERAANAKPSGVAQLFIAEDFLVGELHDFDLAFTALSFPATGGPPCSAPIFTLPVDPEGGQVLLLQEDAVIEIQFQEGFTFPFFGRSYASAFISSNGYLTFGKTDWRYSVESLTEHYLFPRIAALFTDLKAPSGSISWKQLSAEAVAVSYVDVTAYVSEDAQSTFQIILFASGEVQIAFLNAQPLGRAVVGLSSGSAPSPVQSVHLKEARGECEAPMLTVSEEALAIDRWTPAVVGEVGFFSYDDDSSSDMLPLANSGLRYGPRGGPACRLDQAEFPIDPSDGEELELMDDDSVEVEFTGGFTFPFFDVEYSSVWVGSNGYLTFGTSDISSYAALEFHYKLPRISALLTDLDPSEAGEVSWKQIGEEAFAVTYSNIQAYGETEPNSFQVTLYANGEVVIIYKELHPKHDVAVGISAGVAPVFPMSITSFVDKSYCPADEP